MTRTLVLGIILAALAAQYAIGGWPAAIGTAIGCLLGWMVSGP